MHDGEVDIDVRLVEQLVAGQFPHLADLPIDPVTSTATVNAIFRLGDRLCVRLPRVAAWSRDLHREWRWLPELAPQLSLRIPEPVELGRPASSYPFSWAIYRWIDGARLTQMSPSTTKPWPRETSRGSSSSCAASIRSPMHPPPVARHWPRPMPPPAQPSIRRAG